MPRKVRIDAPANGESRRQQPLLPYLKYCTRVHSTLCWRASDQPTRNRRPTRHSVGRGAVLKQDREQFERRYHLRDLADVLAIAWSIPGLTGHIISVRWLKSWTWSVQIAKSVILLMLTIASLKNCWSFMQKNGSINQSHQLLSQANKFKTYVKKYMQVTESPLLINRFIGFNTQCNNQNMMWQFIEDSSEGIWHLPARRSQEGEGGTHSGYVQLDFKTLLRQYTVSKSWHSFLPKTADYNLKYWTNTRIVRIIRTAVQKLGLSSVAFKVAFWADRKDEGYQMYTATFCAIGGVHCKANQVWSNNLYEIWSFNPLIEEVDMEVSHK